MAIAVLQGHFQIVLSNEHCPLFQKDLSWFQRLMYCSGVWSYVVGAITAPMFIAIPLITIWAGVFPIVVSWWAAGQCLPPHPSFALDTHFEIQSLKSWSALSLRSCLVRIQLQHCLHVACALLTGW